MHGLHRDGYSSRAETDWLTAVVCFYAMAVYLVCSHTGVLSLRNNRKSGAADLPHKHRGEKQQMTKNIIYLIPLGIISQTDSRNPQAPAL